MNTNKTVTRKRHIAKTITLRITGTIDTMLIGWFVTGSLEVGAMIGGIEVVTKMILYYAHERVWYNHVKFGVKDNV